VLAPISPVYARDAVVVGKTYPIAEPDALLEMEQRAAAVNWEEVIGEKDFSSYRPKDLHYLPKAKKSRAFTVDLTYAVPEDIRDKAGLVAYPAGYRFNPLEVISLPNTLVFLNGKDKEQLAWFKASPLWEDISVMVILTDGDIAKLSQSMERPLYFLTDVLAHRLNLSAVPSVVKQKGKLLEVREYAAN
jgi:conjugal transfer pilus assembly protein TraW